MRFCLRLGSSNKGFFTGNLTGNMTPESRNNEQRSKNGEEKLKIRMHYQNDHGYGQLVLDVIGLLRSLNEIHGIERRRNSHGLPSPVVEGGPLDYDYCITTCRLHMCGNPMGISHFYVRKAAEKEARSSHPGQR